MNLGFTEIMGILVVALLIFGPRKLPELGKNLGAGLREFRKSTQNLKDEFEGAMREEEPKPAGSEVTVIRTAETRENVTGTPVSAQSMVVTPTEKAETTQQR